MTDILLYAALLNYVFMCEYFYQKHIELFFLVQWFLT